MARLIQEGDTVNIHFEHVESEFYCVVLHMPVASGDSWILQRPGGQIVYVQAFSKMVLIKEREDGTSNSKHTSSV